MASPFRGSSLLWASALDRNGGLFSLPYSELLRDEVTLWVKCGGRFPLDRERRFSLVVRPRSFHMGLVPLSEVSLRALLLASRFLVVLTTAPCLGVLQALSGGVTFVGSAAYISYVPQFGAQSESLTHSIPRSFLVESLSDIAEGLDVDLLLCPACALRISLNRSRLSILFTSSRRVFAGGIHPLRVVTLAAGACPHAVGSVGAHGIRGGSTYIALHRTWSVSAVLASATWGSGRCFLLLPAQLSACTHWRSFLMFN